MSASPEPVQCGACASRPASCDIRLCPSCLRRSLSASTAEDELDEANPIDADHARLNEDQAHLTATQRKVFPILDAKANQYMDHCEKHGYDCGVTRPLVFVRRLVSFFFRKGAKKLLKRSTLTGTWVPQLSAWLRHFYSRRSDGGEPAPARLPTQEEIKNNDLFKDTLNHIENIAVDAHHRSRANAMFFRDGDRLIGVLDLSSTKSLSDACTIRVQLETKMRFKGASVLFFCASSLGQSPLSPVVCTSLCLAAVLQLVFLMLFCFSQMFSCSTSRTSTSRRGSFTFFIRKTRVGFGHGRG